MSPSTPSWLIEAQRLKTEVLDRLEQMSPEARQFSPSPQVWSAAQMVGHLVLVEELLVSDWRIAALQSPALKPNWRGSLLVGMVNAGMRGSIRIPTRPFLEPIGSSDLGELSDRWSAARKRLPDTFPTDASSLWIVHPIFGPLSRSQMGSFLVAHLHYHLDHWPGKTPDSQADRRRSE